MIEKICIKKSKIHGRGCVSTSLIKKGVLLAKNPLLSLDAFARKIDDCIYCFCLNNSKVQTQDNLAVAMGSISFFNHSISNFIFIDYINGGYK